MIDTNPVDDTLEATLEELAERFSDRIDDSERLLGEER